MATVQTTTKTYPFLSGWLSGPVLKLPRSQSFTKINDKNVSMNETQMEGLKSAQQKSTFSWIPVVIGCIIGALLGGIALATALTYWLSLTTTPQITTTTTTSTTTSTRMKLLTKCSSYN
ncbi:unnamed protein product [Rotaria sp. Silwood1]|nr:unnamed protein product [Rotaria sp. Silwood1]CAF3694159.1 unnamed protein product [Rotaria sp. Silwood1]CAF4965843.1 unnamed protein product [Rotaria sp. Silwood1]